MKHAATDVLEWASSQNVAPGDTQSLKLPPDLLHASQDGLVDVAAIRDGRRCVLLKQKVGYKDNFEGIVACSGPFAATEVAMHGSPPREYLGISGHGVFEELYVRRRIDDRTFEVYFDLN